MSKSDSCLRSDLTGDLRLDNLDGSSQIRTFYFSFASFIAGQFMFLFRCHFVL